MMIDTHPVDQLAVRGSVHGDPPVFNRTDLRTRLDGAGQYGGVPVPVQVVVALVCGAR